MCIYIYTYISQNRAIAHKTNKQKKAQESSITWKYKNFKIEGGCNKYGSKGKIYSFKIIMSHFSLFSLTLKKIVRNNFYRDLFLYVSIALYSQPYCIEHRVFLLCIYYFGASLNIVLLNFLVSA